MQQNVGCQDGATAGDKEKEWNDKQWLRVRMHDAQGSGRSRRKGEFSAYNVHIFRVGKLESPRVKGLIRESSSCNVRIGVVGDGTVNVRSVSLQCLVDVFRERRPRKSCIAVHPKTFLKRVETGRDCEVIVDTRSTRSAQNTESIENIVR